MELSAFSVVDAFPEAVKGERDRFRELLQLADAAETSGLASFWVAEHHFHPGGINPAPAVLLAHIAARTRRIRIGSLVSVLPFHSAVEIAESYSLVDQLSGGRLNFGAGSGYIALELEGFGVDPATKRERFDRTLEAVLAGFRGDPVEAPGAPGGVVRLNIRARQQPHPPLWIAAQRREALPFIASRGASVALVPYATVGTIDELASEIQEYRRHLPPGHHAGVSVALHLYAGPNPDGARRALQSYLDGRLATQSTFYQDKVRRDPSHASAAKIESSGFALFGSATEVRAGLERYRSAGVDELLGIFDFGGLPASDVVGSVRSLGEGWRG